MKPLGWAIYATLFVALWYFAFFKKKDSFDLFIYPDRENLTQDINGGHYETAKDAQTAAKFLMYHYPNGDYEIGKNRKRDLGNGVGVYEETFR